MCDKIQNGAEFKDALDQLEHLTKHGVDPNDTKTLNKIDELVNKVLNYDEKQ